MAYEHSECAEKKQKLKTSFFVERSSSFPTTTEFIYEIENQNSN